MIDFLEDRVVPTNTGTIHLTDSSVIPVEKTHFLAKTDVYAYGNGLADGLYDVEVVVPGGKVDGGDLILGISEYAHPVEVVGGHFTMSDPHAESGPRGIAFSVWYAVKTPLGAQGFDDTTNNGGVYQVVIGQHNSTSGTVDFSTASVTKSKNFKVGQSTSLHDTQVVTNFVLTQPNGSKVYGPNEGGTTAAFGSTAQDFATVTVTDESGAIVTEGTVNFQFFGPDGLIDDSDADVGPDGKATDPFISGALPAGAYYFVAAYSDNGGAFGDSQGEDEPFTIQQGEGAKAYLLTTDIHHFVNSVDTLVANPDTTGVALGDTVHDYVKFTPLFQEFYPTGTVSIDFFKGITPAGSVSGLTLLAGPDEDLDENPDYWYVDAKTFSRGPLGAGNYSFQAHYIGGDDVDPNYDSSDSAAEPLVVNKATLTLVTTIHNATGGAAITTGSAPLATSVYDTTAVTGAVNGFSIGTISYKFNNITASTSESAGSSSTGPDYTSSTKGPLHAGDYTFQACLTGYTDNYILNPIAAEPLHINKGTLTLGTVIVSDLTGLPIPGSPPTANAGILVHDTATLSGTMPFSPAGTLTYTFYPSLDWTGTAIGSYPVSVSATGIVPPSPGSGMLVAGSYSYKAVYAGNPDYCAAIGPVEPLVVTAVAGRMTGGGSIFLPTGATGGPAGTRVTHGFEIHSTITANNRLEINWGTPNNNFHLTQLTSIICLDDPRIAPPPPAGTVMDTMIGTGTGTYSIGGKKYAATVSFTLTDAGEPGTKDTSRYVVTATGLGVVLDTKVTPILLTKGNHQSHTEIKSLTAALSTIQNGINNTFTQLANSSLSTAQVDAFTLSLMAQQAQFEAVALGANITGLAFNDVNKNGIFDPGETGYAGLTVKLYSSTGTLIATTTTDASGYYKFTAAAGSYYVSFAKPTGKTFSAFRKGSDPVLDSDVNASGVTPTFSLASGGAVTYLNAGLY